MIDDDTEKIWKDTIYSFKLLIWNWSFQSLSLIVYFHGFQGIYWHFLLSVSFQKPWYLAVWYMSFPLILIWAYGIQIN